MTNNTPTTLIVSFRGKRTELDVSPNLTIGDVKSRIATSDDEDPDLPPPSSIKLIFKGKVLSDDGTHVLSVGGDKKIVRFMATGVSQAEQASLHQEFKEGLKNAPRIRDDLTKHGQAEARRRQRMGQALNQRSNNTRAQQYSFGRIETLPNLPDEHKARELLNTLANDPGVLACMAKHEWNVGCLAELYPKGNVGKSAVCVMGLNRNKGQQILLRLRTDDLKGFRKMLSIRKVLFHELAHNVHSAHDGDFFQLMRQIEQECNEMDWTKGSGISKDDDVAMTDYEGGSYRLGGTTENLSVRELAARAAMSRLTMEEKEIYANCGCGQQEAKFLPTSKHKTNEEQKE